MRRQVTGGLYRHWQNLNLADVGYPIAEISDDGSCVITKPAGTGGVVNRHTVVEQLVYEIGDPAHYLTPTSIVDFTTVEVDEIGPDRVRVHGAYRPRATDTYKVRSPTRPVIRPAVNCWFMATIASKKLALVAR